MEQAALKAKPVTWKTELDSEKSLQQMMGRDSNRVRASMTLFWLVTEEPVFNQMLDKFCDGKLHEPTVKRLRKGD